MTIQEFIKEAENAAEREGLSEELNKKIIQHRWFVAGAIWAQSKADNPVKEAIEMAKPKWISVKDKLPEHHVNILLYDGHEIVVGYYNKMFNEFHLSYNPTDEINPTHWMNLPKEPNK